MWVGAASIPCSLEKQKQGGLRLPGQAGLAVCWSPPGHSEGGLNPPLPWAGVWRAWLRKMKKINKSGREK